MVIRTFPVVSASLPSGLASSGRPRFLLLIHYIPLSAPCPHSLIICSRNCELQIDGKRHLELDQKQNKEMRSYTRKAVCILSPSSFVFRSSKQVIN